MTSSSRSGWTNALALILVSGVAAGLAGFAGQFAVNYITSKQPKLVYWIEKGPSLEEQGRQYRIYEVEIRNVGKKGVEQVLAMLKVPNGEIERFAHDTSPGVQMLNSFDSSSVTINAEELNENEWIRIKVNLVLDQAKDPNIFVRGKGIVGSFVQGLPEDDRATSAWGVSVVAAALSAMAVLSFIVYSINIRSLIIRRFPIIKAHEVVQYILANLQLSGLALKISLTRRKTTYLHVADLIVSAAQKSSDQDKKRYIAALKCMLVVKEIDQRTIQMIIVFIKSLEKDQFDSYIVDQIRESAVPSTEPSILTDVIDRVIKYELTGMLDR